MGLRPVSHMAIYRYKSGLGSISLVIGYNAASITKQTKVDIERVFGKSSILDLENLLNNRPRKRLGGLTPLEVFKANCCG